MGSWVEERDSGDGRLRKMKKIKREKETERRREKYRNAHKLSDSYT